MIDDYNLPPNSYEDERAVLGAIMLDAQSDRVQRVFSFLAHEMFYNRQHSVIYQAMRALNNGNQNIDLLTVHSALEESGKLDGIGGFAYLAELSKDNRESPVRDVAIKQYCERKCPQDIARLINYRTGLDVQAARRRVVWCSKILDEEMFYALKREMENEISLIAA